MKSVSQEQFSLPFANDNDDEAEKPLSGDLLVWDKNKEISADDHNRVHKQLATFHDFHGIGLEGETNVLVNARRIGKLSRKKYLPLLEFMLSQKHIDNCQHCKNICTQLIHIIRSKNDLLESK